MTKNIETVAKMLDENAVQKCQFKQACKEKTTEEWARDTTIPCKFRSAAKNQALQRA